MSSYKGTFDFINIFFISDSFSDEYNLLGVLRAEYAG